MGTAERIERERAEKRKRILDAARELFVERGVEAVTLREIADRIEYSTTAIYVHFKDKAALVDAMVNDDFAHFASGLEKAMEVADPVVRLRTLHDAYIDFALSLPRHYQLLFLTPSGTTLHDEKGPDPAGIQGYRALLATIEECIAKGLFLPGFSDAHATAQTVWATVHGLVSLLIVQGKHKQFQWASIETLRETSFELVARGLFVKPPEELMSSPKKRRRR